MAAPVRDREALQRLNFLFQATHWALPLSLGLARFYCSTQRATARRLVLRMTPRSSAACVAAAPLCWRLAPCASAGVASPAWSCAASAVAAPGATCARLSHAHPSHAHLDTPHPPEPRPHQATPTQTGHTQRPRPDAVIGPHSTALSQSALQK